MNKNKDAVVQCFLHELKELSKKYDLWIEGEEMALINSNCHIVANHIELVDNDLDENDYVAVG